MSQLVMLFEILSLALAAGAVPIAANEVTTNCGSSKLYVASYGGGVHSLEYTGQELKNITWNGDCGAGAVWLELDKPNNLLYCSGETAGIETSFSVDGEGKLSKIAQADVVWAPVNSILFNKDDKRAIALANYAGDDTGGPGITILTGTKDGKLDPIQYIDLSKEKGSGVNPERQAGAHPHQTVLDPTGKFIIVPDLGSDILRVYSIDLSTNNLNALDSVTSPPGSGPRHGIFWSPSGPVSSYDPANPLFFIVTHELTNDLITYAVTYPEDGKIKFEEKNRSNTFGGAPPPSTALASELQISPDNKFLYAANRLDASFTVPAGPGNDTQVPSDSLGVFEPKEDGALNFVQLAAVGGSNPRHFSINKRGDLVAAALVASKQVVLLKRDVANGRLGEPAAVLAGEYDPTTVIFDE